MACFTVPLATAVAATAAKGAIPESRRGNPFVARLGLLCRMMFGGSFLLAIEHVYHGEVIFSPPFLTAVKNGETAEMLHEMATRGVAMAVLVTVVWAVAVGVSVAIGRAERRSAGAGAALTTMLMFAGAALMWSVDCVGNAIEGEPLFDFMDAKLGCIVIAAGLLVYAALALFERRFARA